MNPSQVEENAEWFVEHVSSREGKLKEEYVDKAKDGMESYLKKKDE